MVPLSMHDKWKISIVFYAEQAEEFHRGPTPHEKCFKWKDNSTTLTILYGLFTHI